MLDVAAEYDFIVVGAGTARIFAEEGKIVTVVTENNSFRLVIDGDTVATVPRTTSHEINRFKAHATHPRRRRTHARSKARPSSSVTFRR